MKTRHALLALAMLAGFGLRLACIGSGLPSKSGSMSTYNPDETIALYSIAGMVPGKLNFHPGKSLYWGSLYTYMTAAALKAASVAGYLREGSREFFEADLKEADKIYLVGRGVSVLAGVLCIPLMYLAGEALAGVPAGLLAAALMAVSAGPVMASAYLKPDALLLLLCTCTLYLSILIFKKRGGRACMWAGLAAGLAAAAKYNGATVIVIPLLAAALARDRKIWQVPVFFAAGFVAGCPYSVLDPDAFLKAVSYMAAMGTASPPQWNMNFHGGLSGYFGYYLRYALGWPLQLMLLVALGWAAAQAALNMNKPAGKEKAATALLLAAPAVFLYALFASSCRQVVLYGVPLWPVLFLLTAWAAVELYAAAAPFPARRRLLAAAGLLVLAYTFVYAAAYAGLFYRRNVREEAAGWMRANIGRDKVIGLTKKYFWTPPGLRGPGAEYRTISVRDDSFDISEGALSLRATAEKADYLVLSDFEIKDLLRLPAVYPAECAVLADVLGRKFSLAARFETSPHFLGVKFRKYAPPWDWMYPFPTIYVYRKNASALPRKLVGRR